MTPFARTFLTGLIVAGTLLVQANLLAQSSEFPASGYPGFDQPASSSADSPDLSWDNIAQQNSATSQQPVNPRPEIKKPGHFSEGMSPDSWGAPRGKLDQPAGSPARPFKPVKPANPSAKFPGKRFEVSWSGNRSSGFKTVAFIPPKG